MNDFDFAVPVGGRKSGQTRGRPRELPDPASTPMPVTNAASTACSGHGSVKEPS